MTGWKCWKTKQKEGRETQSVFSQSLTTEQRKECFCAAPSVSSTHVLHQKKNWTHGTLSYT